MKIPRELKDRCVNCKYWKGNKELVLEFFNDLNDSFYLDADDLARAKNNFLNSRESWCNGGVCSELLIELELHSYDCDHPEVPGVFSCILFKAL